MRQTNGLEPFVHRRDRLRCFVALHPPHSNFPRKELRSRLIEKESACRLQCLQRLGKIRAIAPQKAPVLTPDLQQQLRSRIGPICIAITGSTAAEMIDKARAALADSTFLEFRLDFLDEPHAGFPWLQAFLVEQPHLTAVATCRRSPNGGRFKGSLDQELQVLASAASAGFQLADLEIESAEQMSSRQLANLSATGMALIVSYHDFQATGDLDRVAARIARFDPEFAKIVPTAQSLADNLRLFRALERSGQSRTIVGIAMGERGLISRVLGPRFGSAFTFASTAVGEESAPGQITARTLLDLYRIKEVSAATKIYGVAGSHVRSSLSPLMHNTAFRGRKVNAVYLPLQVDAVDDLLTLVRELPIHGLSVTMPYKQQIMPHLDSADAVSRRIGAVNTVLRTRDGKLSGFNTDVGGVTDPLERRLSLKGARVLLLGAGGAARAAAFGLADKGAHVAILNRTPGSARVLAQEAGAEVLRHAALGREHFDVLVNATPLGMAGFSDEVPLRAEEMRADLVFDLVYNPLETPLLRMARERGVETISGIEMFVAQGVRQFELWIGSNPPVAEMREVVERALGRAQKH